MTTLAGGDVRRLLRLLRAHPLLLPTLTLLGLAASLAEAVGIGVVIPLVGAAMTSGDTPGGAIFDTVRQFIVNPDGSLSLARLGGFIFALIAAKTVTLVSYHTVAARTTARIEQNLRISLWDRLINAEMSWFSRADLGEIHTTFDRQVWRVGEALTALTKMIVAACTILVYGTGFVLLSARMALLMLVVGVPVFLIVRRVTSTARESGEYLGAAYAGVARRIAELTGAMRTIRLFNRQAAETARFTAEASALRSIFIRTELLTRLAGPVLELLYLPIFFAVLVYALQTNVGPGVLLAFLVLLFRLQSPLRVVDASRMNLAVCSPAVADVTNLLSTVPDERSRWGADKMPPRFTGVRLKDVHFTYPGSTSAALQGITAEFRRGEIVAVIGPSGAGKSTLVNMLFGLYRPDSGQVLVNDVPLDTLNLGAWRERTAFAGQDSELLGGTVRFNLAYGTSTPPDDAAIRATASAVGAEAFIDSLPAGYDTDVGARGGLLSGGQRQRIALGRALLRHPDLLVLDEATNAVDTETELAIQRTIAALRGRTTVVIIAHRSKTVEYADRVLLLEAGRITEDASPEHLSPRATRLSGLASSTP